MKIGDGWEVTFATRPDTDQNVMRIRRKIGPTTAEYISPTGMVDTAEVGEVLAPEVNWIVPEEVLQGIIDALWQRGLRPADRRYDNELKLLTDHLVYVKEKLDQVMPCALRRD